MPRPPITLLSSGHRMPLLALGTYQLPTPTFTPLIRSALKIGYTHFDTAYSYNNEHLLGSALSEYFSSGRKREDVFITTKL
jgi:diketogulonate reductase-like aldo/keto reductase